ncbi:2-phosphosulfolactate phosphatase [Paenibacillus aurantius]|uniref:Probable 2-phosphosulfolactate phosphatase n=1 Tax=Paenibacillus aurantius TaxID=2918900 RepID=A0AA96LCV5_9BACL|nr:2-phosphosulfolactate phosphatase [Paenibacillus aurantius]WNQ09407.1 2-phosphosulfolactate phosphatase [Paenibacillus aurantius]
MNQTCGRLKDAMRVEVISGISEARSDEFVHKTAVIIDVLRATSNMVTALAFGSSGVAPVETVQQAVSVRREEDLLGGERNCRRIPGFDLGNSPFEYMESYISGRRVVMTTTNGTRAIQKSLKARHVLAASLLNARACAEAVWELRKDVMVLCSGTQDNFSLEDGLGAGFLLQELAVLADGKLELNDFGKAMLECSLSLKDRLEETLLACANGVRLTKLGYRDDVLYCARLNQYNLVPVLKDGQLVRYALS